MRHERDYAILAKATGARQNMNGFALTMNVELIKAGETVKRATDLSE